MTDTFPKPFLNISKTQTCWNMLKLPVSNHHSDLHMSPHLLTNLKSNIFHHFPKMFPSFSKTIIIIYRRSSISSWKKHRSWWVGNLIGFGHWVGVNRDLKSWRQLFTSPATASCPAAYGVERSSGIWSGENPCRSLTMAKGVGVKSMKCL